MHGLLDEYDRLTERPLEKPAVPAHSRTLYSPVPVQAEAWTIIAPGSARPPRYRSPTGFTGRRGMTGRDSRRTAHAGPRRGSDLDSHTEFLAQRRQEGAPTPPASPRNCESGVPRQRTDRPPTFCKSGEAGPHHPKNLGTASMDAWITKAQASGITRIQGFAAAGCASLRACRRDSRYMSAAA